MWQRQKNNMQVIPIERKFLKKSIRSDYTKPPLEVALEAVDSSISETKEVTTELVQKVDDKMVEVDFALEKVDSAISDLQNIEIPKGEKGEDGISPNKEEIINEVVSRVPKIDEDKLVSKVLKQIPQSKSSLKIIQESIDQDKLIEEILPKIKIKTENVEGLDTTLKSLDRKALDRRYMHGGGDTVKAGTNVTITTDSSGNKVISAIDNVGAVDSVNGYTGIVVLTKTDLSLGNVDNTSDANKPVSSATQTALDLKANTADIPTLASGVYTPTVTAESNLDATTTATQAQYLRVGSVVTVSGRFTANPTLTATSTSFELSLPVASNFGAVADCGGVAFCGTIVGMGAEINAVIANDTVKVTFVSSDVNSNVWSYQFSYRII